MASVEKMQYEMNRYLFECLGLLEKKVATQQPQTKLAHTIRKV